jgi:hypothetical protein
VVTLSLQGSSRQSDYIGTTLARDHPVQLGKGFLYLFFRIDAYDDDRKIH